MGVLFGRSRKRQRITGPRAIERRRGVPLPLLVLQIGQMLARAGTLHRHDLDEGPLTPHAAWPGHRAHRAELAQGAWQAWLFAYGILNVLSSPQVNVQLTDVHRPATRKRPPDEFSWLYLQVHTRITLLAFVRATGPKYRESRLFSS